jgi:hypothetical protein
MAKKLMLQLYIESCLINTNSTVLVCDYKLPLAHMFLHPLLDYCFHTDFDDG